MTIGVFVSTFQPMLKNDGTVNAAGTLEFYEPGQVGSTAKVVYSNYLLTTSIGSTITLDSNGRKVIYLNGDYDLIEKDSAGTTITTRSNINPSQTSTSTDINLITNGSFESNTSNIPTDWTLFEWNSGANIVDSSAGNFKHGAYATKFVSTGSGGGTLTTNSFFAVSDSKVYSVEWLMKSSDVGVRNIVQFLWYDEAQVALGTPSTSIYDAATAAAGNATSWTRYLRSAIPPTGARFAKLKIIGCDSSDATSGTTWFDGIIVTESLYEPVGVIKQFGSATAPNGYLNCDGAAISRTTYADLFTVISTTFGVGDGSTTFNIPDFRRRIPVGVGGAGTATLGNAMGNTGGEETHAILTAELPQGVFNTSSGTPTTLAGGGALTVYDKSSVSSGTNVMQPSLVVNYIIKY